MRRHLARRARAVLLLVGALVGLGVATARAGDPAAAKTLVASAREALEQKKLDIALTLLAKARSEDPELLQVLYWTALTQEKRGDSTIALREYRAYRDAAGLAQAREALTKEDADLLKKGQARIAALAPGEAEDARLCAALAGELLGLAKPREAKDRGAAALALESLLLALPTHEEGRAALGRVTATPLRKGEFPLPDPLRRVAAWNDMIAKTPFGDIKTWHYVEPGLVVEEDDTGRTLTGGAASIRPGDNCVLDMEVRIVNAKRPTWGIGFALVNRPDHVTKIDLQAGKWVVEEGTLGTAGYRVLEEQAVAPFEAGAWHKLSVLVQKTKLQVWVDGRKAITVTSAALRPDPELVLSLVGCKAELRVLRWARWE